MNHCGNCANYVWGDQKTPLPIECITCKTTHVPKGEHPTPSHWKAKPQTNADRIRAWNDHELAETLANFISDIYDGAVAYSDDPNDWLEWLQQPAKENNND